MKVGLYQFNPVFGDRNKNLEKIEQRLSHSNASLVVLPELCTTGYQFNSKEELNGLCESIPDRPSIEKLSRICQDKNLHLVAGIGEKEKNVFYNSAVLIGPNGHIGTYRKVHLFDEEKKWFRSGNVGFKVWDIGITKIGMMICFDWIFPESARTLALKGAEIICHPANLILPYCPDAMITRLIENRIFSITANRIGTEHRGIHRKLTFIGLSQVVNTKGEILFRLKKNQTAYQEVELDPAMAKDKQITSHNHLLKDRKTKYYKL